uniref:Uncharacterized protein n=1 Tax=Apis cerana TaxID=7461 RepID=V9IKG5_APICE
MALKRAVCFVNAAIEHQLTTKTVKGSSLTLQSVNYIHGSYSLPLGMLSVSDSISDNIFQEYLQYTSCFFVDQSRNTLHTTTTSKTTNGWFGNTLDVITQNLSMTLCSSLSPNPFHPFHGQS